MSAKEEGHCLACKKYLGIEVPAGRRRNCDRHYMANKRLVDSGAVTWDELVAAGLCALTSKEEEERVCGGSYLEFVRKQVEASKKKRARRKAAAKV